MKKKEKAYSIALASTFIIFLILVSSATAAPINGRDHKFTVPEITGRSGDSSNDTVALNKLSTEGNLTTPESIQATALKLTETPITTNKLEQWGPIVYNNKIVWYDNRNGNWDIYMYDLSTKKETQITTNVSDQYSPYIYGNRIVWVDERNRNPEDISGNSDIYMYDLSTKKETQITNNEGYLWSSSIYDDKMVWTACPYGDLSDFYDICMYNVSTKNEKMITDNGCSYYPAIYGNKIVWVDYRNGYTDVYMYDISTKKETQITNNESEKMCPAIYGDKIVWMDSRNENWDIYMYNLTTKKETQITTGPSDSLYPAIYGDRIVWNNNRKGNWDVYVYDLATGQKWHTTDKSDQYYPAIYGDRIVWTDMRNGNPDIYMGTLSKSSPVAAFSASPNTGKAPLNVAFTDTSTGSPTSWFWNFGDGSKSFLQNPIHKYSKVGKYTVSLTVKNAESSNTVTKKDYINVVTKPVAAFSASPNTGKAPLNVAFTDKSTGIPTKWKWSFGDGTISREKNPKHQYSQEGNYKITLTVTNVAGSSTVTKTNYIKVTTTTRPGIYSKSKITP
ncbi:PKD domain-containing protein [Methanosarcina barkeri]|uniref:Cell surface protein n=1 Tax=Methanosarcina barkeri CM1 TaxID=796385 RepID=A0A0G3CBK1_METBA|nr:PKD domain-containing protein [Methanosarcina barkeri]AKJ39376.1 cell surface protein [Methanosarcina barkeri CM1]